MTLAGFAATILAGPAQSAPTSVTIAGTFQSELGCTGGAGGDWDPPCAATFLTYDASDDVWQGTFDVGAGNQEYKAALDGSWALNYGLGAAQNGPNIPVTIPTAGPVKFYYDDKTHWVTDNVRSEIVTAVGDFQMQIGCSADSDPGCLRSWLEDPDEDGIYTAGVVIPTAGTYSVQLARDEATLIGSPQSFTAAGGTAKKYFTWNSGTGVFSITDRPLQGNIFRQRAHWISRSRIVWSVDFPPGATATLYSATSGMTFDGTAISGGNPVALTLDSNGMTAAEQAKWPHLAGANAKVFVVPGGSLAAVPDMLRGQIAIAASDASGLIDATGLQIPGALDDLFTYSGALGVSWAAGVPTIRLWAPTARSVTLNVYDDPATATPSATQAMTRDDATGTWSATGDAGWKDKLYLYDVEVYVPSTKAVEHNIVTDPYSVSLSMHRETAPQQLSRSQIVDLDDPALKPQGWDALAKPALDSPLDIVLYELHIRDFSANDSTVTPAWQGTYKAFADPGTNGMKHLARLAQAGLTHVHLLPAFDIATIDEDKSTWLSPPDLSGYAASSDQQQAAVNAIRGQDGFNWGYDPFHYTTPEGSYSTDPNGSARILELREMVQGLANAGLRVVMDVVYNHTNSSGQGTRSVLDRIVPGYYHRLNADGVVEKSTCCDNTAPEHAMMEKLMIDSLVTWAKSYKVDGFRFDLMGHIPLASMAKAKQALQALTVANDGVDGSKIYLYGEAWSFGEVAGDSQFVQARQLNMAGSGIGSFSDRIRDAVRGGSAFGPYRKQGWATGMYYDQNDGAPMGESLAALLGKWTDLLRVSLAGNLKTYPLVNATGATVLGQDLKYPPTSSSGDPAGYAASPEETIQYVSAHDNETLFDAVQVKAANGATLDDRVRMNELASALVLLSQGVPFFHAGDELLRSKSLDRNSYDSGDWFNRIDWTYQTNNWAVGLPLSGDNGANWDIMRPLLGNPALKPTPAHIAAALESFEAYLKIRKSSPLFRLRTAADIQGKVRFHNTGPSQIPGLIVMELADEAIVEKGAYDRIVVLLNPDKQAVTFDGGKAFENARLALHPILAAGSDAVVKTASYDAKGTFSIPARTAAVFVHLAGDNGCGCTSTGAWPMLALVTLVAGLWRANQARARRLRA